MNAPSLRLATSIALAGLMLGTACERIDSASEPRRDAVPPSTEKSRHVAETGRMAASALMSSLGGQLKAALESGGPVQAIDVCHQAALPLTTAAGAPFEHASLRRTTLKPRNPANAPDDTDRAVLERLAARASETGAPPEPLIEWLDGTARYYQPLVIQAVCLKCHGDPGTFPPELVEVLAERYPDDMATGYALGDLRGVIRVDVDRR